MYKPILIILLHLFITYKGQAEEIGFKDIFDPESIDVSIPYSSGIIDITPFESQQQRIINFSNGTTLSLNSLLGWSVMSYACYGALAIDDSITSAYYKHDNSIGKYYDYYGGSNNSSLKWLYSVSLGSNDTDWGKALVFPDSLISFDSIAIENNDTSVKFTQGKCYAVSVENEINPMICHAQIFEFYNTIFYLNGPENIHFKMQIYKYEYGYHPDGGSYFKYVHLRWAIDSCGNKKFIPDNTTIFTAKKNSAGANISPLKIANQNGRLLITANSSKRDIALKIFDLKGRVVFNNTIEHNINLNLTSGAYLLQATIGRNKYLTKISITKID